MLTEDELKDRIKKAYRSDQWNKFFTYKTTKKGVVNENWVRQRCFTIILYPESMIDSLENCLKDYKVPCAYCIHDKDMKEDGSGEIKKIHIHLNAQYSGKTTLWRFYCDICASFGCDCFNKLEYVSDKISLDRYLIHLDDSDKFQYSIDSIFSVNGYDYLDSIRKGSGDFVNDKKRIKKIINDNNFIFFNKLDDYLDEFEPALALSLSNNRELSKWCHEYIRGKEHDLYYAGKVEKGYTVTTFKDGVEVRSDNYRFNRKLVSNE